MADAAKQPDAQRARESERVRRVYEKEAHKHDREMRVFERLLFAGGREWSARKPKAKCSSSRSVPAATCPTTSTK